MAKLGEGDSRWIVAERPDGANPNAWHWDQKDKTKVCEARLKDLFTSRTLYECPEFKLIAKELQGFEGDVTIANRKGKLRCFFEIKFTVKWSAMCGADELLDGKLVINDCDTQNYFEAYDISVTSESSSSNGLKEKALEATRSHGRISVRAIVKNFIDEEMMKANGVDATPMTSKSVTTINSVKTESAATTGSVATPAPSKSQDGITFNIVWTASLQDIYECFTKEDKIAGFTRAPCSMKSRVCGDFTMLGGAITGTFVELVEGKRIVMKWRLSSWKKDEGTNSVVTIDFGGVNGAVTLSFSHTGVPSAEVDRVKQGWEVNFWGGMKQILGYGNDQ